MAVVWGRGLGKLDTMLHPLHLSLAGVFGIERRGIDGAIHKAAYDAEQIAKGVAERADGEYRWHLVRVLPIRIDDAAIIRWVGSNTDIHEQKVAEVESSRDLERRWNLSPVLKVIASPSEKISAVNPAWTRTLGWPQEETLGRNFLGFIDPERRTATLRTFRTLNSLT